MNQINVSILTIGSEILYGHILDTNAHFLSGEFSNSGFNIKLKLSVHDSLEEITRALNICQLQSEVVLITGGLGPTNDDMTKKCLAEFFNASIIKDEEAFKDVAAFFKKRGLDFSPLNQQQAYLPAGAKSVKNEMGTAPGIWLEKDNTIFIAMPGVPHEMKHMVNKFILPLLIEKFNAEEIIHKTIMTAGIGESWLSEKISDWEKSLPEGVYLAYLPGFGKVKLRLTGRGFNREEINKEIKKAIEGLYPIIEKYIYGEDNLKLEERIGQILREKNLTLSTAESCTGGYISHLITSIPGSSDYFMGGIVAYDNKVKVDSLGIDPGVIEEKGAVSEETVRKMAVGARERLHTDIGLATSGISGPGGGSDEKPVGTIWIAVSDVSGTVSKCYNIPKDRESHIKFSSTAAMIMLWQRITQKN